MTQANQSRDLVSLGGGGGSELNNDKQCIKLIARSKDNSRSVNRVDFFAQIMEPICIYHIAYISLGSAEDI